MFRFSKQLTAAMMLFAQPVNHNISRMDIATMIMKLWMMMMLLMLENSQGPSMIQILIKTAMLLTIQIKTNNQLLKSKQT